MLRDQTLEPYQAGVPNDYCRLPLSLRKTNLARLLARRSDGIHAAPFEQTGRAKSDRLRRPAKCRTPSANCQSGI